MARLKENHDGEINRVVSNPKANQPRLLDNVSSRLRFKHYSLRTEVKGGGA